ncbi:uncharacterized protein LOC100571897 [Acyrthosiphon pisum]|uniref:Uncharacterized protein n=1 Tax=Acyrthosiphon pisum TaxID=7029 RepID=A0A8R1W9V1_ACYPI|nr:uncharacterized protein LOC100571897 [Acyrthosiphon pisum]|eukprot:XP_003241737.2 PREDICTED: uncharacterized protein LOC100571897 [Acyrthosiphon pisum]
MLIKKFGLILFFSSSQSENLFRPNLPAGEYRLVIDNVYPCETTKNHPIQFNWYLSKKTSSITELKGNTTLLIPFDDTLTIDYNFASWGSTGGWVPNAHILKTKKACSNVKHLSGNAWLNSMNGFNIPTYKCPIPAGTYITSGIDKKKFEDMNFPKTYFYGKYKVVCRYKNLKNEVVGCVVVEVNLIRPWETPI